MEFAGADGRLDAAVGFGVVGTAGEAALLGEGRDVGVGGADLLGAQAVDPERPDTGRVHDLASVRQRNGFGARRRVSPAPAAIHRAAPAARDPERPEQLGLPDPGVAEEDGASLHCRGPKRLDALAGEGAGPVHFEP